MEKFFRNPEIKGLIFKWVLLQIILLIVGWVVFQWQLETFKKDVLRQNTAVIGQILQHEPDMENEIIGFFTKTPTEAEIQSGENITKQYGYDEKLTPKAIPYIHTLYQRANILYLSFFLLNTLALLLLVFIEFRKVFHNMKRISDQAQQAVEGNFRYLPDSGEGEYGSLVHHFNNMSNRLKETIEKLSQEKLFLKETLSDISHQIKTPLSSLLLLNDILLNREVPPEKRKEFLQNNKEQLDRMEWLILSLLKTAKMEAGSIQFNKRLRPIREPIEQSIASLQPAINQKQQTLQFHEPKREMAFLLDMEWLSEAFSNILKNCVEHTEVGGTIEILLDENPVAVTVIIQDHGKGISPKDLPHIFKRFYRAHGGKGIGIGLSLAKTIIEKHHGVIRAKSQLGEGTQFTITFFKHTD
ncbi:HAMP domain-containing sensor histidine kinase [Salinithrix halophila]|uniref:histidine kinase n=1 Tax=Salinithrix halophila TaxID=1485204 RepID=A0ABV8JJ76_9BACL